jgi:hypothetical protein
MLKSNQLRLRAIPSIYLDRDTATRTRSIARWWEAQRAAHRPAVADGKARKPLR